MLDVRIPDVRIHAEIRAYHFGKTFNFAEMVGAHFHNGNFIFV